MPYENTFKVSLIISFLIHGFILYQLPSLNTAQLNKSIHEIEVSYYKFQMLKLKSDDTKLTTIKNPVKQSLIIKKESLPSPVTNDAASFFKVIKSAQKSQTVIKQIHLQKKISVPAVKSDNKIKSPKYNSYYQAIRDDIRRYAYSNYLRYDNGEVYLVFVVLKDGSLKDVKLVEEKTKAPQYLKQVALKSIKDASPYPRFPEELSYPELTFNVIISFEVSD